MSAQARKLTNHYTGEHARPVGAVSGAATSTGPIRTPVRSTPGATTQRPRMALVSNRQCSRTGCSEQAAVTLTYDYTHSHVWIDQLIVERDPHAYDMCARHAERLSVPNGWRLEVRVVVGSYAETSVA